VVAVVMELLVVVATAVVASVAAVVSAFDGGSEVCGGCVDGCCGIITCRFGFRSTGFFCKHFLSPLLT
jgi:hypothetical protein